MSYVEIEIQLHFVCCFLKKEHTERNARRIEAKMTNMAQKKQVWNILFEADENFLLILKCTKLHITVSKL
jgi:hypothetical protein